MLRRILVPLDGSKFAEVAVPVALRLAQLAGAELRFALAHEPELLAVPVSDAAFLIAEDEVARRERDTSYLHEVVDRLGPHEEVRIATRVLDGSAGPTLAREIASWGPDLVVLATHGRGPASRFWQGSVTDYLLRHVEAPLLLLKPRDAMDWPPPDLHLKSMLVAWDLSHLGEAILPPVSDLAAATGATIELIHIVQPPVSVPVSSFAASFDPSLAEKERDEAERELARVANQLREKGLTVQTLVTFEASVPGTLINLVNNGTHDLVALATHGRGGLSRALMGSVADRVVRGSNKPVLVVHPAA